MNPGRGSVPAQAGIGLRFQHHRAVAETRPAVGWLEVHSENYMGGGEPIRALETVRRDYPVSLHGIGLSLGSADGIDPAHLDRLAALAARIEPALVSDHLSWSLAEGRYLADLLPLPLTEEALGVVASNVIRVQERLGRRILVENPSSYLTYGHSTIPEAEFLAALVARTGCGILCDVNNIYVSARNHGWDMESYLAALPPEAVAEIHLAGHSVREIAPGRTILIDDHGGPVCAEVWALYTQAIVRFGRIPTLIEWDTDIPPLPILLGEAAKADALLTEAVDAVAA